MKTWLITGCSSGFGQRLALGGARRGGQDFGTARDLGRTHVAFCSVIRPDDHPARPAAARTNDAFWRGRGYESLPGAVARFSWKDLGDSVETEKPLQFWMRQL